MNVQCDVINALNSDREIALTPDSLSYKLWSSNVNGGIPIYFEVNYFNLTNPTEFENGGKPRYEEIGPYVFREFRQKEVLKWNNNGTVTFRQRKTYKFLPELSGNRSLSDRITNVNPIVVGATHAVLNKPLVKLALIELFLVSKVKLVMTASVEELTFKGVPDRLLKLAQIAQLFPYDKFGWFYPQNASTQPDGLVNIFTGGPPGTLNLTGILDTWNGSRTTPFYKYVRSGNFGRWPCNAVNGTFGDLFPPEPPKTDVTLFATGLCRSMTLQYNGTTNKFRSYVSTPALFSNSSGNECFCTSGKTCRPSGIDAGAGWTCRSKTFIYFKSSVSCFVVQTSPPLNSCVSLSSPPGVVDNSACHFGAPAYVSLPHFLYADPSYRTAVGGMQPSEDLHTMSLSLHHRAGVIGSVNARLQINLFVEKVSGFKVFRNITPRMLPMFWFNERAQITRGLLRKLDMLDLGTEVIPIIGFVFLSLGCLIPILIILVALIRFLRKRANQTQYANLVEDEEGGHESPTS
ncbi:unnamed protein product [Cyprideis torosa]|uniref:Uncharacterized protein n=1 Tax=Cyprideis torosa TaxID=163714 RepID=A0A7R8WC58_9CRUS|nr:unnamed protein product [Cyprideis torosa]CAG0890367.1 unnamed protein product [Cyprideis torosa]